MIKANYTSIVKSDQIKTNKIIGGSANMICLENASIVRRVDTENKRNPNSTKVKCIVKVDFLDFTGGEIIFLSKKDFDIYNDLNYVEKWIHLSGMNKNKVRNKIISYAKLNRSKTFLAFYSISFPKGLDDKKIRKIHNTVLTRLRKYRKSFSYIWVAERQKNETLHFHLLTNEWFNIKIVNHMYKKAIQNSIKKDNECSVVFNSEKYNGVDVKRVSSIDKLTKYLTKYVTKNSEKMEGLCWNCCALVSSLITHLYLNQDEFLSVSKKLIYMSTIKKELKYSDQPLEIDVYIYGSYRPKLIFEGLTEINNYIQKKYYNSVARS